MYLVTATVPGCGHAAQVVAAQVDEHHVLGPLLGVALQAVGEGVVLGRRGAARPRAGDRVRGHAVALDPDQQLRARPDDGELRHPDEEEVRARVDAAQRAVERHGVERLAADDRPLEGLAAGDDDLDRLAGGDRLLGRSNGRLVLAALHADFDLATPRRHSPTISPTGCAARPSGSRTSRRRAPAAVAVLGRRAAGSGSPARSRSAGRSARGPRRWPARRSRSGPRGPGRFGVERGDGRERVGQVVEDQDQVRLLERGHRDADRVFAGSGTVGSNVETASYASAPTAPPGNRGMSVAGQDAALRHELAQGRERIGRRERLGRQVGAELVTPTGRVWIVALPSRTSAAAAGRRP
jgi:hypothetical protein